MLFLSYYSASRAFDLIKSRIRASLDHKTYKEKLKEQNEYELSNLWAAMLKRGDAVYEVYSFFF